MLQFGSVHGPNRPVAGLVLGVLWILWPSGGTMPARGPMDRCWGRIRANSACKLVTLTCGRWPVADVPAVEPWPPRAAIAIAPGPVMAAATTVATTTDAKIPRTFNVSPLL